MYGTHIVSQIKHSELKSNNTLYVVGVISNPSRFHSRYRIYREWEKAMKATRHVKLVTVESAFGDRCHEVTTETNPDNLQVRTKSEIWTKENMINLGFRKIITQYPDARYLAWIDCDVFFSDPNWALETIHQLQSFHILQPWSECLDLGPLGQVMQMFNSFGKQHQRQLPKQMHPSQPYQYAHSGFAWACTREFYENTHGLMDFAILGSADHHMAFACTGDVYHTIHGKMSHGFFKKCLEWQEKAVVITKKDVGYVTGRIEHSFHGPKGRRYYRERWQILVDHKFDPTKDLLYDVQGLLQLMNKPDLEKAIQRYNRSRAEDSIEIY